MARYGQEFKDKALARLLPPESADLREVAREIGVSVTTLERWREQSRSSGARERRWTAAARLEAVIATAAMTEQQRSAWCRGNGVYPADLAEWKAAALQSQDEPMEPARTPAQARADRHRIRELERELKRKEKALAEAAALLVLRKKLAAIFHEGGDE